MTYTTERAEKEALKLYKKELRCNHQEAIEAYCSDWDASGINTVSYTHLFIAISSMTLLE